ncbi:hypothetical protein CWE09_01315 [Aliidiomarina minuta]|uniref:DUF3549 domain-containing protein n=1 Tax=Aliidiomarina minuta TaxID=880057 RepID=A0A432W5Q8_9GAMM|nr:DUF3549 family protein [Aliidiomarina minuta]RUO25403.1 hypothetical protein CWE09_01315 [Aliidiomarina minuta]
MNQDTLSVDTLTEFLKMGDTHYYIFDLSRLVRRIENEEFAAMEAGMMPFPTPMQQHAWLGIVFWHKARKDQPYVWFAKFPLDERGLLSHGARQHYLQIIVEALGRDITAQAAPEQEELLKQNPYIFTPPEQKRAAFHAKVGILLEQSASIYYEEAEAYISGHNSSQKWQDLGVQGLHDVASRLSLNPKVAERIATHFEQWPEQFQHALSNVLEHHLMPSGLVSNLNSLLQKDINNGPGKLSVHLLRSLASAADSKAVQLSVRQLLSKPLPSSLAQDLLIIVAARCWPALQDSKARQLYIERLSDCAPELFPHLFADLVGIPQQRPHLLQILRSHKEQPESVQQALAQMTQQVQQGV